MEDPKYVKIQGYILEVIFNKDELEIFVSIDVNGNKKTVVIKADQLIKFDIDRSTKQSLMLKYYEAWKVRKENGLPVNLELTEEQFSGGENV